MERRITHSCGHEQAHTIMGTFAADCDRQAARLARQKCRPCYVVAKKAVDDAQAEQDMAVVAEITLVALDGSAKQVAWAETIRVKRIAALRRTGHGGVAQLAGIAEAKWWIDHRDLADDGLLSRCPVMGLS